MIRNDYGKDLRPITVRFTPAAWRAIREMAEEEGISQAELVRVAVAGNLNRYLGTIRYVDSGQGEEIKVLAAGLMTEIANIGRELNRIGVNYNQEVRLTNIDRKYGNEEAKGAARKEVLLESEHLSKKNLDVLIERYEQATRTVGEALCRILG